MEKKIVQVRIYVAAAAAAEAATAAESVPLAVCQQYRYVRICIYTHTNIYVLAQ